MGSQNTTKAPPRAGSTTKMNRWMFVLQVTAGQVADETQVERTPDSGRSSRCRPGVAGRPVG